MKKQDFPLLQNYMDLAYLDNAATTQKPEIVIEAIKKYYETTNANVHRGIYELSEKATAEYEKARGIVAEFIKAKPAEIVFTSGTTDSINKLANSLGNTEEIALNPGEIILTSEAEHHSNILPWQQLAKTKKLRLEYIKLNENLTLDLDDLKDKINNESVRIIALNHISNVTGVINPVKEISQIIKNSGKDIIFVLDSAQSIAHIETDVRELGIDFLAFSGHKMYGPTGIGVLFGRQELLEKISPLAYGGGMIREVNELDANWAPAPEKHEAGTPNIAGAIALAAAVKYIEDISMSKIYEHEISIAQYAKKVLDGIREITIAGPGNIQDMGIIKAGVFSFSIKGIHAHDVAQLLSDQNIAVRAGHHCCQLLHRNVLKTPSTTRASIAIYNTEEDFDRLAKALKLVIQKFR